jgi:hypothetical protein
MNLKNETMFKQFKEDFQKAYAEKAKANGLEEMEKAAKEGKVSGGAVIGLVFGIIAILFGAYVLITL